MSAELELKPENYTKMSRYLEENQSESDTPTYQKILAFFLLLCRERGEMYSKQKIDRRFQQDSEETDPK